MAQVKVLKMVGGTPTAHDPAADSVQLLSLGIGGAAPASGIASAGLTNTGAEVITPTTLTGSRALAAGDRIVIVAAGWAAPGTLTLPANPTAGRIVEIYDDANLVSVVNTLTLDGNGKSIVVAGTGAATLVVAAGLLARKLVYTGTVWFASVL